MRFVSVSPPILFRSFYLRGFFSPGIVRFSEFSDRAQRSAVAGGTRPACWDSAEGSGGTPYIARLGNWFAAISLLAVLARFRNELHGMRLQPAERQAHRYVPAVSFS